VLRGDLCSGGGKLMYSVLTDMFGSCWWSEPAWFCWKSPTEEGNKGLKLKPKDRKEERMKEKRLQVCIYINIFILF